MKLQKRGFTVKKRHMETLCLLNTLDCSRLISTYEIYETYQTIEKKRFEFLNGSI